jgi:magnesium transporter
MDDGEVRELIEKMPPDEAVWVLDDMSDRRIRRVMELLEPAKSARIKELQKHDRHSAGRLMTNEYFSFSVSTSVAQVAEAVLTNPGIELTRSVFIQDEEGRLVGFVTARSLIISPPYLTMGKLMRPVLHKVTVDTSRDEVVDLVERYKLPELPVVDDDGRQVGVINYEDVVEALEDIADETIASMAGTAEDVSEHEPILKRFFWRAPWLLVTLCAGLVTATAMNHFNDRIWFIVVPFFVPLINMMSGNVGLQCSTMLVRAMSTGELSSGSRLDALIKELGIGLLIGCIFGVLCGVAVYCMKLLGVYHVTIDPIVLGATVSFGLLGACMTATTLGAFSPFFFARFGIDPAVASGPIVTSFNDVLSTLIFFMIAWGVHSIIG